MKNIRIGSRNSPLALWQAREVARHLQNKNYKTEIIPIISTGDKNLAVPLYEMGITGVFTKDLDVALLENRIDIAVHSLKDIPTKLPNNLSIIAYLKRDFPKDVLVKKESSKNKEHHELKIATSSLRRRAFWLKDFPETEFCDIRGNVNTRLKKLEEQDFDATIFSQAAIERMKLKIDYEELTNLIPAPGQGVIAVVARTDDAEIINLVNFINDDETQICVETERIFLQTMEGGCTAPIGAFAEIIGDEMRFRGRICSLDGKNEIETDDVFKYSSEENFGEKIALEMLKSGAQNIMNDIKAQ
ncbi:hydroxymethylbilane synthase [Frigoriflavimonas asaccharolytica]|uniref:Hydroxymethylbilane synthase n=1 Tax=Frigoriflavimonas asaccharolytica TaxID=2735899 RepID=A0A8J8GAV2_9FLAO|nr:hydroxymethylbilane synthase [Frigoriflavimonas asaccharolytica]NRS92257.1 hydroxymethylbilane synthase [Frigoriflavimonas asaccharolytica]